MSYRDPGEARDEEFKAPYITNAVLTATDATTLTTMLDTYYPETILNYLAAYYEESDDDGDWAKRLRRAVADQLAGDDTDDEDQS